MDELTSDDIKNYERALAETADQRTCAGCARYFSSDGLYGHTIYTMRGNRWCWECWPKQLPPLSATVRQGYINGVRVNVTESYTLVGHGDF